MASVRGTGIRRRRRRRRTVYEVRYRDPVGEQHSKTFDTEADARRFLTGTRAAVLDGSYIPPAAGAVAFGVVAEDWYASTGDLKIRTQVAYRSALDHNLARWRAMPIGRLGHLQVQQLVNDLVGAGRAPPTVRNVVLVARHVFEEARRQRLIRENPCRELRLPRLVVTESTFLTRRQVQALASALSTADALLVLTAAGTGLRAGELAGLRAEDLDLDRHRLTVRHSLTYAHGELTLERPKSAAGRRTVPLAPPLSARLADHVAAIGAEDYVFGSGDGPHWHNRWYQTTFQPAVRAAGVPARTRFHDLRHTYASQYRRERPPQAALDVDGAHHRRDHDGPVRPPLRRGSGDPAGAGRPLRRPGPATYPARPRLSQPKSHRTCTATAPLPQQPITSQLGGVLVVSRSRGAAEGSSGTYSDQAARRRARDVVLDAGGAPSTPSADEDDPPLPATA